MSEINVTGLKELAQFLDELPAKIQKNVMRGSLRAGMKVVQEEAKSTSAFADKTGQLRAGLKIGTTSRGGIVTASLKAKGKHGYIANIIEYGAKPHAITAKNGGALSFGGGMVKSVNHPGIRPHPFMRPALDGQAESAVVAAAEYMKQRLADKHGLDTADILIEGDE